MASTQRSAEGSRRYRTVRITGAPFLPPRHWTCRLPRTTGLLIAVETTSIQLTAFANKGQTNNQCEGSESGPVDGGATVRPMVWLALLRSSTAGVRSGHSSGGPELDTFQGSSVVDHDVTAKKTLVCSVSRARAPD